MSRSRTKGSTGDEANKRFQLALTNVKISRRDVIGILGTGAVAVLAYFATVPSLSADRGEPSHSVTTIEATQTVATEEIQTT